MLRPDVAGAGRLLLSSSALGTALLLPKCPLCVAAWLVGLGAGARLAAGFAPLLRPIAFAVAVLALSAFAAGMARRRRGASPAIGLRESAAGACCRPSSRRTDERPE